MKTKNFSTGHKGEDCRLIRGVFLFHSLRFSDLARQRGGFRYIVKAEELPGRNQMLVGFLKSADELPEKPDVQFVVGEVINLEVFAPNCGTMKRNCFY